MDILSKDQRTKAIEQIIYYFASERNEEIGVIAAEDFLDLFLETTGKIIYNQGISVASDFYKQQFEVIQTDIEMTLKK